MPRSRIDNIGSQGLVTDINASELAPQAFTQMQNVRCNKNRIESFPGHELLSETDNGPKGLGSCRVGNTIFIVYPTQSAIYSLVGGVHRDITRDNGPYTSTNYWWTTNLGSVLLLGNGADNPQYWGGVGRCVDLPFDATRTWDDARFNAKVIRAHKNFCFALNVTEDTVNNAQKLVWSHPAEPGSVPSSWDVSDTTKLTGDTFLSDTTGVIVDGLSLRDYFIIYKEDAIYTASYTGGTFQFQYRPVSRSRGILSRDCVCDVGGRHFVVGDGDIYLFDGHGFQSVARGFVLDEFFNTLSKSLYERTFVTYYRRMQEVWVCYPTEDNYSIGCNRALVYNLQTGKWYPRELPQVIGATYAAISRKPRVTWDSLSSEEQTWDGLYE